MLARALLFLSNRSQARRGCVIGPYGLMIAGHARSRGLVVVTGNLGEFTRMRGLLCEDWQA